jgi:hypothetical protein
MPRRFPPPWFVEEIPAFFIVRECKSAPAAHLHAKRHDLF